MKGFKETKIPGVLEINFFNSSDNRGTFVKPLHKSTLEAKGLNGSFAESFYSVNKAGVIRGMHFQTPPDDHDKIVYCSSGRILDVILDIRKNSSTYGQYVSIEISGDNYKGVYIPKGFAHGFCSLEDNSCMVYLTSTEHSPGNDAGILYSSFGFEWPVNNPIVSERDLALPKLEDYSSPF